MPFISVKMYSGRTDEQKKAVALALGDALCESLGCPPTAVTVDIQEVEKEAWHDEVSVPFLEPRKDKLLIKGGTARADW